MFKQILAIGAISLISNVVYADAGNRIDHKMDRKGDRIEHRLDHKGDRIDHRLDRRSN